jgi:hydrogenase 3 maturation protease
MPKTQNLKSSLKNLLKGAKRIAVLGVGSDLRSDDVAGMLVAEKLKGAGKAGRLKVFFGATAPENLTGEIKRFKPTHLLIVDAAEIGKKAGTIALLSPEETVGITFSTHSLPLKIMSDYLLTDIKCRIMIIGIQPKKLAFGGSVSKEVKEAAQQVSGTIKEILASS